jgi:hypothetical protein
LEATNGNWPVVSLRLVGDGRAVARALLRILVRRALISEGMIHDVSVAGIARDADDSRRSAS